ncbi:Torsin-3A [Apodemus speciosus]|uniref:Torsin-3A n=1 Tax=Apodemus speciosus TaxID=105296 RepID=A0ABQ0EEK0_APOSI
MFRGALWLLLLLSLRPPGAQGHRGATSPGQEADEATPWPSIQRLQEQLRTAGTLSKRYWALFSCTLWPDHCEDQETPVPPLGLEPSSVGPTVAGYACCMVLPLSGLLQRPRLRNLQQLDRHCLESDLRVRLHGQHLASKLVLRAVRGYLETPHGGKALALSFHGWSGTGKNFVARMLVDNLYRDGMRSDCVRMFISTFHFPHPKQLDEYKEELQRQMQETQRRCHQSTFIFDEAEKLHPGLLELLEPSLEPKSPGAQGAEAPRAIFLFLSNLGGSVINEAVLGLFKAGWSREEITMQHLEKLLQTEIMESADSSFGSSRLLKEGLIDLFIPFLPLEFRHVRLCVRDAFLGQNLPYTEEALDEIAKMMTYVPEEERLFSSQGCKSISQRINLFLP